MAKILKFTRKSFKRLRVGGACLTPCDMTTATHLHHIKYHFKYNQGARGSFDVVVKTKAEAFKVEMVLGRRDSDQKPMALVT